MFVAKIFLSFLHSSTDEAAQEALTDMPPRAEEVGFEICVVSWGRGKKRDAKK